ncbi:methyltransferase [Pseudomonas sp. abacavir_1]
MLNETYKLNKELNIFMRDTYKGIAYNDGDETEERILSIIQAAENLSVFSSELKQYCTDWPSLYHLSSSRANILRPFKDEFSGASVLEIGAGCGAITRYLGECAANVLALEGSPRRATIARSRTRDLENVTLVSERFDQFDCDSKFDFVTLIGVLEYANLFTSGPHPAKSMLERAYQLLKPNGRLIIAIENQLGLKYFAGAPEDHLGASMYGVEDRYQPHQPKTYGRQVLTDFILQSGFSTVEFMAPFPDYKLPVSIVTESGFSYKKFDAAAFAVQSARRDPQLPEFLTFSPELVWPSLAKNDIALDMANSFLITAGKSSESASPRKILAYHYSTERYAAYCKETIFQLDDTNSISVNSILLSPDIKPSSKSLEFNISACEPYYQGHTLSTELVDIITHDNWKIEEIGDFLRRYLLIALGHTHPTTDETLVSDPYFLLPGEYFDLVPQNIISLPDGSFKFIDREWSLKQEIPIGWLIFRSLLLLLHSVTRVGVCATKTIHTRREFVRIAFESAGFIIDNKDIDYFAQMEAEIQSDVSHRPSNLFSDWRADSPLATQVLLQAYAQRDRQVASLRQENETLFNAREALSNVLEQTKETLSKEQEEHQALRNQLDQIENTLKEEQARLTQVLNSSSWRVTKPLRAARRYSEKFISQIPHRSRQIKLATKTVLNDPGVIRRALQHIMQKGFRETLLHSSRAIEHRYAPSTANIRLDPQQTTYILTTPHCLFVAELIKRNLEKAGFPSDIIFGKPQNGFSESLHFVICPQMFSSLPGVYIAFQMEQSVSSRWFNESYLKILENSFAILDYSTKNIQHLQDKGLSLRQIYHAPISYIPEYRESRNIPKEYDILFYGDVNNDRRRAYLNAIKKNYKVKVINDSFGENLYQEVTKARLVLNIHYYEGALLETTRLYECLSLGAMIISEKSSDMEEHPHLNDVVDFVPIGDINCMVERIDYWLKNPIALQERLVSNKILLCASPNLFNYYFNRFLLATDNIDFDKFYELAGENIELKTECICLGLPEAIERKKDFEKDNTEGFQYFPGLRHSIGWVGCGLSYKFLIRKAKEQGFDEITICEDDVEFLPNWVNRLKVIRDFLRETPSSWDIFAGLIAHLHPETKVVSTRRVEDLELIQIDRMVSMVFNIYSSRAFERILSWDENNRNAESNTIDRFIESQSDINIFTTTPFIVGHKEELSSTLWGFKNTQYSKMIADSSRLLQEKVSDYKSR